MTKLIGKPWFRGFMVRCEHISCMTGELAMDWLEVVWNIRPEILLCKWGISVRDVFKGHF